ncbi:NUDIX domain-containing protein [Desulfovibrio litoralis]|uniref:8-oxo-dGTP diphosphatase n=1 Tax=Desulfovibrio litoralis DSM 11393 TaxID=1121455 RepID=A0A1M7SP20_9BACT|nr:NUDIX hydrolase [Desulfovibrio litoralis]SHN60263.1 8-oxo-dGTP diphosphatase [Desulfovibrio litoralis DSM 11393]
MNNKIFCPKCNSVLQEYKNPALTVDIIVYTLDQKILLIERINPPHGLAIPGGFVDYGETTEHAALRELKEETGIDINNNNTKQHINKNLTLFGVYSDPKRDPRQHTVSIVYYIKLNKELKIIAADDAKTATFFSVKDLPQNLAFDHKKILFDFINFIN